MFVNNPFRRETLGTSVKNLFVGGETELPVDNPFKDKLLDIQDTIDPVFVSYIEEYIAFSSSRISECDTHYGVAGRVVAKEWEDGGRETLSVPGPGDTLAYYPAKFIKKL